MEKITAVFHGCGGRECEREHANKLLEVGKEYEVVDVDMGPFSTFIGLSVGGEYNSVMFDVDYGALSTMARNKANG